MTQVPLDLRPATYTKRIVEAASLSVMGYGDVNNKHASASFLKPLDSVYHSALRIITG